MLKIDPERDTKSNPPFPAACSADGSLDILMSIFWLPVASGVLSAKRHSNILSMHFEMNPALF